MLTTVAQRWRFRRDSYRPAGEPIRTSAYEVAPIALFGLTRAAKRALPRGQSYPKFTHVPGEQLVLLGDVA